METLAKNPQSDRGYQNLRGLALFQPKGAGSHGSARAGRTRLSLEKLSRRKIAISQMRSGYAKQLNPIKVKPAESDEAAVEQSRDDPRIAPTKRKVRTDLIRRQW